MLLRRALLTAALALPLIATAQTVDVGGAKFDTSTEVAGQTVVLNGAGVRYRAVFKVYGAGIYLKAKADTPEAAVKMDGPKRVLLKMMRDVDGKDLGKAFTEGMEKNLVAEERARTINGIFKFGQIFQDIKKAASGSVIQVDWVPGTGALVYFDGKQVGETIPEQEFYNALLRIWLGDKPADDKLKQQLLGKAR
ncbi:MAG: chalcone isomerase family protein [Inhella sp.]